ncbi:hypothetical protein AVTE2539_25665 [Acidovorax sp. SUPP2539]|nr:hypothetical protein AVTE2539_25665 [Acidovorax sp. SUPP2539]
MSDSPPRRRLSLPPAAPAKVAPPAATAPSARRAPATAQPATRANAGPAARPFNGPNAGANNASPRPAVRPAAAQAPSRPEPWQGRSPDRAPQAAARRGPAAAPLAGEGGTSRLNKRMAELGLCSRREADDWIAQGWVKVNGEVAPMGLQVLPTDRIEVERVAQGFQEQKVTILMHKPMGYVSGQAEDGHTPAVALINPRTHWREDPSRMRFSPPQLRGLAPCGRLDIDSVGLLVLTQDGRVARQLIGEDSDVEKEYLVRVQYGEVALNVQDAFPAGQLARLCHGLALDGQPLRPARVDWQNPEQLRFVLKEGKKRQIRRMCELVGLKVVGLKRIRIGRITLGNLPVGQWRYLGAHEKF